ncbi:MAG: FHA domain-containing protein [Planctomycetota bacterium]
MRVVLTIQNENAKRWIRDGQQLSLGRTERADWIINHPTVSSLHCTVHCDGHDVWVEDHRSTNGTLIGGQRIERSKLADGQVLKVGQVDVAIEIQAASPTGVPPATDSQIAPSSDEVRTDVANTRDTANREEQSTVPLQAMPPNSEPPVTPAGPGRTTRSISKRIHLIIRPPHGSQRRITLLAGQQITLGKSEWADVPVGEDDALAPRHLDVRYFGGKCQVSVLVEDNSVFIGDRPLQSGDTVEPGEIIRVAKTFVEFRPIDAAFTTELATVGHLRLSEGHLLSAPVDVVAPQDSAQLSAHFDLAHQILWPPHNISTLLTRPTPLIDWCDPTESPIVQTKSDDLIAPSLLFAPRSDLDSAVDTLRFVARGQAGEHSVAIPKWSWIAAPLKELPALWATCPEKTRRTLLSQLKFLMLLEEHRWWLLGDDPWLATLRLPNIDVVPVSSIEEMT